MKKRLLITIPLMMMLLTGCGGGEDSSTSSSSSSSSSTTTSVKPDYEKDADHGTKEEPLTVAQFIEEAKKLQLGHEQYSKNHFFVTGYVQTRTVYSNKTKKIYDTFRLSDSKSNSTYINVGGALNSEDNNVETNQNDTIVIEGLAECYNDYYSIWSTSDDNPLIHSVSKGTSTLTTSVVGAEKDDVTFDGLNETYTNGETAKFKVTNSKGGILVDVSLDYGGSLTADGDGYYSFVTDGDNKITATYIDSSLSLKDVTVTFKDLEKPQAEVTKDVKYSITRSEINFDVVNCYSASSANYLLFGSSTFGNEASITTTNSFGKIVFIQFTTGSNSSKSAEYKLNLSKDPITSPSTEDAVNITKGVTTSFLPASTDEFKHFSIATTTVANGQVASIRVVYAAE